MTDPSFTRINYYLRPNKQVERKILIDILLHFRKLFDMKHYGYVGMGSVYYYDFILIHRILGLKKLISFDSADTVKRFEFNKPYDFIKFLPGLSTEYLSKHDWKSGNHVFWLDYDGYFYANSESILNDIKLLAQNCNSNDIVFLTVNSTPPPSTSKKDFLSDHSKYISSHLNNNTSLKHENFPYLIQNIMHNAFVNENLFHTSKYTKLCSFVYKDQAPMYTIGGFFASDSKILPDVQKLHDYISFDKNHIDEILIPHITYKEKHYLDNNIDKIKKWYDEYSILISMTEPNTSTHLEILKEMLRKEMDFELDPQQVANYIKHYRFMPQYFESMI